MWLGNGWDGWRWRGIATAGTGAGLEQLVAGTGVEIAGGADAGGTCLDVLTNLACAGTEMSGAGVS